MTGPCHKNQRMHLSFPGRLSYLNINNYVVYLPPTPAVLTKSLLFFWVLTFKSWEFSYSSFHKNPTPTPQYLRDTAVCSTRNCWNQTVNGLGFPDTSGVWGRRQETVPALLGFWLSSEKPNSLKSLEHQVTAALNQGPLNRRHWRYSQMHAASQELEYMPQTSHTRK